jgi:two-component sensor histidine kinase
MTALRACDLLSDRTIDVDAESRLGNVLHLIRTKQATHVVVREENRFRGVVPLSAELFRHPRRIFLDTIPKTSPPEVLDSMDISAVANVFTVLPVGEICVFDGSGVFSGIVTREGLYGSMLEAARRTIEGKAADGAESSLIDSFNREKEVLLREVHHRVKNNVQIMISLLNLQHRHAGDPALRDSLQCCIDRIRSIALVHEKLYHSELFSDVDFSGFLEQLVRRLFISYKNCDVTTRLECGNVRLALDRAVPCGIIVNELVANALRHAFPGGRSGEISVSLSMDETEKRFVLRVRDNGVGLPPGVDHEFPVSSGFVIIKSLVRQIRGELRREDGSGTRMVVMFPAGG